MPADPNENLYVDIVWSYAHYSTYATWSEHLW
jgi:hypothetical protein